MRDLFACDHVAAIDTEIYLDRANENKRAQRHESNQAQKDECELLARDHVECTSVFATALSEIYLRQLQGGVEPLVTSCTQFSHSGLSEGRRSRTGICADDLFWSEVVDEEIARRDPLEWDLHFKWQAAHGRAWKVLTQGRDFPRRVRA